MSSQRYRVFSRTALATLFSLSLLVSASGCTKKEAVRAGADGQAKVSAEHEDPDGYYTCPMHPEVHEHKPGKCPICGMTLVKVKAKKPEATKPEAEAHADHEVSVGARDLELAGIRPITVTKMDLAFSVPVSGRLTSSREVAFQVYESDLQVVKPGLEFKGALASAPAEPITGKIRFIDTLLDPSSRTVRALGELSRAPRAPMIEGAFHGEISGVLKNQLVIPEDSVLHTGREDLVYLLSGEGKLKPRAVQLGLKTQHSYQVISGLNEGDKISSGPNFLIDSEAKIRGGNDQTHH